MSELQSDLELCCCRAYQYAWLLEGHAVSPSAVGKSPLLTLLLHCLLLSCTAHQQNILHHWNIAMQALGAAAY